MSDGNGFDWPGEVRRLEARVEEVESHSKRIGALEHDVIVNGATLSRVETKLDYLRAEHVTRDIARLEAERKRALADDEWKCSLERMLASIAAKVGA